MSKLSLIDIANEPIGRRSRNGTHKNMRQRVIQLTLATIHNISPVLLQQRGMIPLQYGNPLFPLIHNRRNTPFYIPSNMSVVTILQTSLNCAFLGLLCRLSLATVRLMWALACPLHSSLSEADPSQKLPFRTKTYPLINPTPLLSSLNLPQGNAETKATCYPAL